MVVEDYFLSVWMMACITSNLEVVFHSNISLTSNYSYIFIDFVITRKCFRVSTDKTMHTSIYLVQEH